MLDILLDNWKYIVGFLAVGLLAFWTFDERDQTENAAETIEAVGERARATTGGAVGGFGSLVVVLVSIFVTIGNELVASFSSLTPLISEFPVLVGNVIIGILAWAGMSGLVTIAPWQFGVVFIALLVVGITLRFGRGASGA